MKFTYSGVEIREIRLDVDRPFLLTGSVTDTPVKVGEVNVEPYAPGFQNEAGSEDFGTVSFD